MVACLFRQSSLWRRSGARGCTYLADELTTERQTNSTLSTRLAGYMCLQCSCRWLVSAQSCVYVGKHVFFKPQAIGWIVSAKCPNTVRFSCGQRVMPPVGLHVMR